MKPSVTVIAACVVMAIVGQAAAAGDPVRGEQLHADCLGCHGTELYVPPKARIKSLSALKTEVERWNDRMNPKFTTQEIEDLVAWLNATFYKFSR
jgi:mono/diheme cytochrome c family protein